MVKKSPYRVSARFKEILEVLVRARREGANHLWKSSRRRLVPLTITHINLNDNLIQVEIESRSDLRLQVGDTVYLKLEIRDSAFKTEVLKVEGSELVLHFPDEIALSENRAEKRIYFHPTDQKQVLVRKIKNVNSPVAQRSISATLADISQTGMALILSPQQSNVIQLQDRVSLEMLGPYRIHPPVQGEVVFKIEHQSRGALGGLEIGSKVGVHLERKIPKATYDAFCVRDSAFDVSEPQLVRDQAFRRDVSEKMDALVKRMRKRKGGATLIQRFEKGSKNSPYLKRHVELLCEVMCGLGTRLGWVSSATLDKLIYIAYLHDARYFALPALARIRDLREFQKVFATLSLEEQRAYLEGPAYAAELARQDSESHPDAAKILLQQKELPDGSGFPGKLTGSQLLPLSCLFLVSHAFVDYVYDHPDWSVQDFVKTHRKIYKGTYFQKIFQAMI
jgi:HD-GYP domain-containing protein (c-di-GMP phosphodiesterase class II)